MKATLSSLYAQGEMGIRLGRSNMPDCVRSVSPGYSKDATYVYFKKPVDLSLLEVAATELGMTSRYNVWGRGRSKVRSLKVFEGSREIAEVFENVIGMPFPVKTQDPGTVGSELRLFDKYLEIYKNGVPRLKY